MTSRERVLAAIQNKPVDKPPLDMTFTIEAYNNLAQHLNPDFSKTNICNPFLVTYPSLDLTKAMNLDCVYVGLSMPKSYGDFIYGMDSYIYDFGLNLDKVQLESGMLDYHIINNPLAGLTLDEILDYNWPDPNDESRFEGFKERCKYLRENTDYAIVANFYGYIFTMACSLRGMENFFIDLLDDEEIANAILGKVCEFYTALTLNAIELGGEYIDVLRASADDYGTQMTTLISKDIFTDILLPHISKYYKTVKTALKSKNPNASVMQHSCGAMSDFIPELIDVGVDILDPVQYSAKGMDAKSLKSRFGGMLAFHGGIDTQQILPYATSKEVYEHATYQMKNFDALNGGYIVAPCHHVQGDVPAQNLIALRDAVNDFHR